MAPSVQERLLACIRPLLLLHVFASAFAGAVLTSILTLDTTALFSLHRLRDLGFANGYASISKEFKAMDDESAVASLVASAHGTVLELGPGTGNQCSRFDRGKVKHIFGLEPSEGMIPALRDAADEAGLGGKYTIVPSTLDDREALESLGVVAGSLDSVVCISVLCSVPDLEGTIREMYRLLKPGGELLFFEHQAARDPMFRVVQAIYNPIWKLFLAGCSFDRHIDDVLVGAGEWESVDIGRDPVELSIFSKCWGRLVKAEK